MTRSMFFDIAILSIPAMIMIACSTKIEPTFVGIFVVSSVFSTLPYLVSNDFNDNFAALYGFFVGITSYTASMVTQ